MVFHCVYHIFIIHPSVGGHLGSFHFLVLVNKTVMNKAINICGGEGQAHWAYTGPQSKVIFNFLWVLLHTGIQSGCSSFQSHQQQIRVPLTPYPLHQSLWTVWFLLVSWFGLFHLNYYDRVRWNLRLILVSLLWVLRMMEHFFRYFLHIFVSFSEKSAYIHIPVLNELCIIFILLLYIFCILILCQTYSWETFSPTMWMCSSLVW